MEDRSFLNSSEGAGFKAPESDSDEQDNKEKKKKNRFSEWLKKLLPSSEAEQEEPEKRGLFELFGNFLGKAVGLQKQEISSSEEYSSEPLLYVEDRVPDLSTFGRASLGVVGGVEYLNPTDSGNEQITPGTPEDFMTDADSAIAGDQQLEEEYPVLETAPEVDSNEQAELEVSNDIFKPVEGESLDTNSRDHLNEAVDYQLHTSLAEVESGDERSTSDQDISARDRRFNNAGAVAAGAVASDLLHKAKHRKIRREAVQQKRRVKSLEKEQNKSKQELEQLKKSNKEQIAELQRRRTIQEPQPGRPLDVPEGGSTRPENLQQTSDISRTTESPELAYSRVPEGYIRSKHIEARNTAEQQDFNNKSNRFDYARERLGTHEVTQQDRPNNRETKPTENSITSPERVANSEQSEEYVAKEAIYEKAHETRANFSGSTNSNMGVSAHSGSGYTAPYQANTTNYSKTNKTGPGAVTSTDKVDVTQRGAHSIYKQAAKQGAMAGIIVLVSFLIIVFLWSLV